ncbi:dimethylsulfoxide reductase [Salmonella enterica]|uniref:DmsC/YnfH family molybdoenzyme membrane anchor subunit n=1 Tax=Salmonella enterica TaxID=28901 RepID=UPI0012757FD1|nr:DmsC/YnfH family molybdoenzyme membrane anchor subunit [Salmonella enterica]EBG6746774.1 dimethylsulfoxide reductase [Salmonella enterica]EBJ4288292.1 dimethylsulfoxide reductase [Salmonella enterica]EBN2944507.1 dimethylsulfoxide reductase [Salmonella enterica]EDY3950516.1 dimethylsulfoxide reductase [Salmonella enterica]EDZ3415238.1 dimethylsulfoxide reductase [Salmonella enterica]
MGSGWHEWPLVLFTVLGQCVAGALIVSGYGWLTTKDDVAKQRIVRSMFFLWLVAVLGKMPPALGKVWLLVSMALGVAFIWAMTLVYQIDTVPTWYNGYTTLAFFLTAFLCGPVFAALLLRIARVPFCSVTFASISGLALVVCVAVIVLQGLSLSAIHSSVQQASHLAPDYGMLQVWRIVLLAAGLGCWLCPLIRRREPHTVGLLLGVVLVLAGEIIGRGLFYGLHMTVGMAVAG